MNYFKFLFLLIVLIISQDAVCQDKIQILPKKKYRYKYKNLLLKEMQLERVLMKNKNAYQEYKKFKKIKKAATIFSGTSIILAVASIVELNRISIKNEESQ